MRRNSELILAVVAILLVTALYGAVITRLRQAPAASGLVGHGLGVVGFVLMLLTESLYSLRKRSRWARWGRMSSWLRFHIFTGLVGPYMVLLHTAWHFNGLAGAATLLTAVVVASGILGRYIYTAVPRSADGLELEDEQLRDRVAAAEAQLEGWLAGQPGGARVAASRLASVGDPGPQSQSTALVLNRAFSDRDYQRALRRAGRRLNGVDQQQARELEALLRQRREVGRQLDSLATARRMLATWHAVHVPLGLALFSVAFVHAVAAVYYATLLR